jgi:hypothetical protein
MAVAMSELFTLFGSDSPADVPIDLRLSRLLASPDRTSRMAAYAYCYANPGPAWVVLLVDAVIVEGTRFGQYWGVRALRRQVEATPAVLDATTRRRIEDFAATLEPGSDAADELRQLLRATS